MITTLHSTQHYSTHHTITYLLRLPYGHDLVVVGVLQNELQHAVGVFLRPDAALDVPVCSVVCSVLGMM